MLRKFAASVALLALAAGTAAAQNAPVKIGVLSDMSSLYADITGEGTGAAARMAAEDEGPVLGQPVQVVAADHQNKADIGAGIVRQWYDTGGVDMVTDGGSSAVALAVEEVSREKHKLVLFNGPASSDITGTHCSPYAAHWNYDTYALAHVTGSAIVKSGGKNWFFIGSDYAFGHALERDTAAVVEQTGGKVLGAVYHPINTADFSSFLLQAQTSKAQIIGLANAGGDTINSIKQGAEFGVVQGGQKFAALLSVHHRRAQPRPQGGAGAAIHRRLLLGSGRRYARLLAPLLRAHPPHADHGAGRRLQRHASLSRGGQGAGQQGPGPGDGEDARDADQRFHDQERASAH